MNLDNHRQHTKNRAGINVNWPATAKDDYLKFEGFIVTNDLNRSSFVRGLIKEFLDKQEPAMYLTHGGIYAADELDEDGNPQEQEDE